MSRLLNELAGHYGNGAGYTAAVSYLGDQLKALRKKHGWSQEELAKRAKVDKQTVFRIEKGGNTRSNTTRKLATALNVSLSRLIDDPRLLEHGSETAGFITGGTTRIEDRLGDLLAYIRTLEGKRRTDFIRAVIALLTALEHARPDASSGSTQNDGR